MDSICQRAVKFFMAILNTQQTVSYKKDMELKDIIV